MTKEANDMADSIDATNEHTEVEVKLKFASGDQTHTLRVNPDISISDLKQKGLEVAEVEAGKTLRLILAGQLLKDEKKLSDYNFQDGHTIHAAVSIVPTAQAGASIPAAAPAAAAAAAAPAAPPAAAAAALPAAAAAAAGPVARALAEIARSPAAATCLTTVSKIVQKIADHPLEEKFRSIKKDNAVFQRKVGAVPGAPALMAAIGFVDPGTGQWTLTPSEEAWNQLTSAQAQIQAELARLTSPPLAAPAGGASPGMMGGLPGMGGMGGGGMPGPDAMAQMLQNPDMLRQAMGNPMVQNMMRTNPQMQQQMNMLMQNPDMMRQAASMMQSNPQMMQQAMQYAQSGQMPPGMGGVPGAPAGMGGGAFPPAAPGGGTAGDQTEQEMTEEQMIAEAIARSLQER